MKAKSEKWRYDGKCGCSVYEACPRCIGIYEQGKKDADGIKATLLIERDKKARKQTFKEVLKEYNKIYKQFLILCKPITWISGQREEFIKWLEHRIKELSK